MKYTVLVSNVVPLSVSNDISVYLSWPDTNWLHPSVLAHTIEHPMALVSSHIIALGVAEWNLTTKKII